MVPSFVVSAEYFYALSAPLPPEVSALTRFRMACLQDQRQTRDMLRAAVERGTISANPSPALGPGPGLTPEQAIRRLRSLGHTKGAPDALVTPGSDLEDLIEAWLGFANAVPKEDLSADIRPFWTGPTGPSAHPEGHLRLVLSDAIHSPDPGPLMAAIVAAGLPIASVDDLVDITGAQWRQIFEGQPELLPAFTAPGSIEERISAFLRHLEKYFDVTISTALFAPDAPEEVPSFGVPSGDPLSAFLERYQVHAGPFVLGTAPDPAAVTAAAADVFPSDPAARLWLEQSVASLVDLFELTDIGLTPELRLPLIEALYARGFVRIADVAALSAPDFQDALTGTVAFDHASLIQAKAGGPGGAGGGGKGPVRPINPDGTLVNCVPPAHLSPLGPVAYLQEMLRVAADGSCADPDGSGGPTLGDALEDRRGPLGALLATRSNHAVELPLIDLVNESLEAAASSAPGAVGGAVYDTAATELAGHKLQPPAGSHDPVTLFEALPEHSTPAEPVKATSGYGKLRQSFSHPLLPYSQPLDVNRSYLRALGSSRYAAMRRFRKRITEFVLDPATDPAGFQPHLWRYPVRFDVAREYLGINPEEDSIFVEDIGPDLLAELYGLSSSDPQWPAKAVRLPHILEYTGLDYCELFELAQSGFVPFDLRKAGAQAPSAPPATARKASRRGDNVAMARERQPTSKARTSARAHRHDSTDDRSPPPPTDERPNPDRPTPERPTDDRGDRLEFPSCPPCCLADYVIQFAPPLSVTDGLRRLAVFVRLWRKLQDVPGARYGFKHLRDICEVLGLFDPSGTINPDFIRQLAAFQMLRDHLELALSDPYSPAAGTGAERAHLLALWVGPAAARWDWAVDHLLDRIRHYAVARHRCRERTPEFLKLLAANLDSLSILAGFDPAAPAETWHAHPTHTLRLSEILAKIYASKFGIGELMFLFTTDGHLGGDDPFALQPLNEAGDDPLQLPDDSGRDALWELRTRLRETKVDEEQAAEWTWDRIAASLHEEFGLPSGLADDPLLSIGRHFFPSVLEAAGHSVTPHQRRYRATLNATSTLMWNTPADGPFRYDAVANQLSAQVPITDEAVIAKIARVKPLGADERQAVQDLYFSPRLDLARLALIFPSFGEADERLIQEVDEAGRWSYFQQAFATFHARCGAIAQHLASHVTGVEGPPDPESVRLAWRLLRHLLADENRAQGPWEDDNGQPPSVTWEPLPSGGAFGALLGLIGGGLLGELGGEGGGAAVWRELRGPMDAFGAVQNEWNAPALTLLPSMAAALSDAQLRFIGIRNGFALTNEEGGRLGGAQGFKATWRGVLLVESSGEHSFFAGSPSADGEEPTIDCCENQQWRVTLKRGQREYVLLSHRWPGEVAPAQRSEPVQLRRGAYDLTVEFVECPPEFDDREDIVAQKTGFQIKYCGADTGERIISVPADRLFVKRKDSTLAEGLSDDTGGEAADLLRRRFYPSLRDARRTYQRAYKAMLFAHRFGLSAAPVADDLQSEIGYMLDHPKEFEGIGFFRQGAGFAPHRAWFDLNLLPVGDNYHEPPNAQDGRAAPSVKRQRAMFDWWERVFDYVELRTRSHRSPEMPAWLLFHEAAENHPDDPAHALRHIGIDLSHADLVGRFYKQFEVDSTLLMDERWAIRLSRADEWLDQLRSNFSCANIRPARPDLWSANDPGAVEAPDSRTGNSFVTEFLRRGLIENEAPRRYEEIRRVNDGLRTRARSALIAYLAQLERVTLPWGGFAASTADLSALFLIDVEAGTCQRASRIEDAITAVQSFVQRARLGLEPGWIPGPDLPLLWDRRFATYNIWRACKARSLYGENWIEWEELGKARASESFRFLEDRLRSATLTAPAPAGLTIWEGQRPPSHPGLQWLQAHEPSRLSALNPPRENFSLLGTEERHARPSWLSSPTVAAPQPRDRSEIPVLTHIAATADRPLPLDASGKLPWWIESAVRLGARFLRVAAAGLPMGSAMFQARHEEPGCVPCCDECGVPHPPVVDEYYFWLVNSRHFERVAQDANVRTGAASSDDLSWYDDQQLPKLLHWKPEPMVHLHWVRVHNGEFKQPRRSEEGVRVAPGAAADLLFVGRFADSLHFEVTGGIAPIGYEAAPPPGFRYDMASDAAEVLPPVVAEPPAPPLALPPLTAYPYFLYFLPGAPLVPATLFSQAVSVAGWLRSHCRFDAALKWYGEAFDPMRSDAAWCRGRSPREDDGGDDDDDFRPPRDVVLTHSLQPARASERAKTRGRRSNQPQPEQEMVILVPQRREDRCCKGGQVPCDVARDRAITLLYVETLLEWGDAVMRGHSPEAFQQARLIFETAARISGDKPPTIHDEDDPVPIPSVATLSPESAPLNPRLLSLYERIEDRLGLIRACLNARRLRNGNPNVDMDYFGDSPLRDGWNAASGGCAEEGQWCLLPSPYRFSYLVQKANELAGEVRSFGAALLAAYEKGDAEYLASLRAAHEKQLLTLALAVRQNQWRDSDWQVQALRKSKEIAQTRRAYYDLLISDGLIGGEIDYRDLTNASTGVRAAGNISEAVAQLMHLIPDVNVGTVNFTRLPIGSKLAALFSAVARVANTAADIMASTASVRLTESGWVRREDEWRHQVGVLDIEIEQIQRQILGAERRRDIALRELNNHQRQIEQLTEVQDYLRDKFTSHELYIWLQRETAALHFQMHELALHAARQSQRAFNYERGHTARNFLPSQTWDDLHEGLMAGERLSLALRQMEKAYLDENVREYELNKAFSLRQLHPLQFLQLKITGSCDIELPEWLFDLDYPGHYMRRIKSVSLTIPAVVGPYSGVHCRLTLLSSATRVDPRLRGDQHPCCEVEPDAGPLDPCACGDEDVPAKPAAAEPDGGYSAAADDPRIVRMYAAREAIATSTGQNDAGLFELAFRDERYLPFEFAGAVSRWRIDLPAENNYFDMSTLSDVVLNLNYTAREGGDRLRKAAMTAARRRLPDSGRRVFDVRNEFPDAWHRFEGALERESGTAELSFPLERRLLGYLPGQPDLRITKIDLMIEPDTPCPDLLTPAHQQISARVPTPRGCKYALDDPCLVRILDCTTSIAWPGLLHGTLTVDIAVSDEAQPEPVRFLISTALKRPRRVYVICEYQADAPEACERPPIREWIGGTHNLIGGADHG